MGGIELTLMTVISVPYSPVVSARAMLLSSGRARGAVAVREVLWSRARCCGRAGGLLVAQELLCSRGWSSSGPKPVLARRSIVSLRAQ